MSYDNELARIVEELNRSAPGGKPVPRSGGRAPSSTSLDQLLAFAARQNASDLLLVAGSPIAMRVNGALTPAAGPPPGHHAVPNLPPPRRRSPAWPRRCPESRSPAARFRPSRGAAKKQIGGLLFRARVDWALSG